VRASTAYEIYRGHRAKSINYCNFIFVVANSKMYLFEKSEALVSFLFGRLGAIEVATRSPSITIIAKKSPAAVGRPTARGSAFGFDAELVHPASFSCSMS